jgi:hypothetical protein
VQLRALRPLIAVLLLPLTLAAQHSTLDLSGGVGGRAGRIAASASAAWQLGPLTVGAGPRLTAYAGAPARFTHRGGDIGLPDTVRLDQAVVGLNLMVFGELRLLAPIAVGANLDLIGGAIGPTRSVGGATYRPSHGSLFLYAHKDHGSLNSEFYIRVAPRESWSLRGGLSHYVLGYTGHAPGLTGRYDRFHSVPFVALSLRL